MVSEKQQIENVLNEWRSGAGGSIACQTVLSILYRCMELYEEESGRDITADAASVYCHLIQQAARTLRGLPENWTYQNRLSEALFDYHYLRGGHDVLGIYGDLMGVLKQLDTYYQQRFSIEHTLNLLGNIANIADRIQRGIEA